MSKIILGLPECLKERVLWVDREFRTNPLSHEPGGSDVIVEYHNEKIYGYDWIKFPSFYLSKIWNAGISKIYINYEQYDRDQQLSIIKQNIKKIFARKYKKENFNSEPFKEIWNSETSKILPWESLIEYNYSNSFNKETALDEYLELQENSLEFENHLIATIKRETAINDYLERQEKSPEYENYLIQDVMKQDKYNKNI